MNLLMTPVSDAIWSLGRAVHRLADLIWDVSDRIEHSRRKREIEREDRP